MFTLGMREEHESEIELVGASYIGVKAVIDFLYSGDLPLDEGNIDYVLETAHLLQVWQAVDFCCQYLEKEVREDNYLYLQELALLYSLDRLDVFIDRFILKHFSTLSITSEFLQDVQMFKLCAFLSSEQVQCENEQTLLQVALQWLNQKPERLEFALQLLSNIRFVLIPSDVLIDHVLPTIHSMLPLDTSCKALIEEAIDYHRKLSTQPVMQTQQTALRGGVERLLLLGGEVSERGEGLSAEVCWLDEEAGKWVGETQMPAPRTQHCVAVLGGFIFTAGGSCSRENGGDSASDMLYRYDPRSNLWVKVICLSTDCLACL